MYHYQSCGLPNVWLAGGYTEEETDYGPAIAIDNLDDLHNAIGATLIRVERPLSSEEFRFLRIELNLSQYAVGQLLGKRSDQAIAKWEKGLTPIPILADASIRQCYSERKLKKNSKYGAMLEKLSKLDSERIKLQETLRFKETQKGWELEVA